MEDTILSSFNELEELMALFDRELSAVTEAQPSSYLNKGERIISLLREKARRKERAFVEDQFLEIFNFENIEDLMDQSRFCDALKYIKGRIESRIIRPAMEACSKEDGTIDPDTFRGCY